MQKAVSMFTAVMAIMVICVVSIFVGCAKKEGPTGPAGKDGANGVAACGTCHGVSTEVLAKQLQWEGSVHATGGHYRQVAVGCSPCHTNEGFRDTMDMGTMEAAKTVYVDTTPPNCRTCHNIHQKYDQTDFANSTTKPVTLMVGGVTTNFNKGNLCANCHQARLSTSVPFPILNGADMVIKAGWGSQMTTQAQILRGVGSGAFEIPGAAIYENSPHGTATADGCVTCHMTTPRGNQAGGHSMNMTYVSGTTEREYLVGCTTCHAGLTTFDRDNVQTDVTASLTQLQGLLVAAKMMDATDRTIAGTYPANKVGVLMNYNMIKSDKSMGVHNAKYVKALLANSIDYMMNN